MNRRNDVLHEDRLLKLCPLMEAELASTADRVKRRRGFYKEKEGHSMRIARGVLKVEEECIVQKMSVYRAHP